HRLGEAGALPPRNPWPAGLVRHRERMRGCRADGALERRPAMSVADTRPNNKIVLHGRKVVGGVTEGEALVTTDTISGWGGINEREGKVIERRHQLRGVSFAGKILVFPGAK